MLISFSVQNFRSIRDLQTFSMEELRADEHLKESNTFKAGNHRLLKSAAIYGPNASGKSNLLNALGWMQHFVFNSSIRGQVGAKIPYTPFRLSTVTENAPSHFEVEFFAFGFEYRYGFEVIAEKVASEWLFRKLPDASKPARLFTREDDKIDCSTEYFKEGRGLEERTRPNALFLSVCAQFNGAEAGKVMAWFGNLVLTSGLQDQYMNFTTKCLTDPKQQAPLATFIRSADLNISNLRAEMEKYEESDLAGVPEDLKRHILATQYKRNAIKTLHAKRDENGAVVGSVEFDLSKDESNGTQKLVALAGPVVSSLANGVVLVIDEVDARLHPLLTQALFDRFHSAENKKNAQLICASHDITLLEPERFRRDQIWFCEKDEKEATELYSLAEFDPQDVRATTKFSRQYLKGLFGAVPKLAQFGEDLSNG